MSETIGEYLVVQKSEVQNALDTLKKEVLKVLFSAYPNRLQPSHIAKILGLSSDSSKAFGSGGYELIRGVLHYLSTDVNYVKGEGFLITASGKNKVKKNNN